MNMDTVDLAVNNIRRRSNYKNIMAKLPNWLYSEKDYEVRALGLTWVHWFGISAIFGIIALIAHLLGL